MGNSNCTVPFSLSPVSSTEWFSFVSILSSTASSADLVSFGSKKEGSKGTSYRSFLRQATSSLKVDKRKRNGFSEENNRFYKPVFPIDLKVCVCTSPLKFFRAQRNVLQNFHVLRREPGCPINVKPPPHAILHKKPIQHNFHRAKLGTANCSTTI